MLEFERESTGAEVVTARRLPWVIEVFLYPINAAGLTMLGLFVVLPFVLNLTLSFLSSAGLWVVAAPLGIVFFIIGWVLRFYLFWYLGLCIRDSADGEFRASDTLAPDFDDGPGETVRQTFIVLAAIAVCFLPAVAYSLLTQTSVPVFWLTVATGGFLMPMALLSVVMQDGLWGLNPFRIFLSILRTHFWYLLVVVAFYVPIMMIALFLVYFSKSSNTAAYVAFQTVLVYLLMVASHLLGRFYFNNEERLGWF